MIDYQSDYLDDSRGLGVAEMAYAIRNRTQTRLNKELAYHTMEVLYAIEHSSIDRTFKTIDSTFSTPEAFKSLTS